MGDAGADTLIAHMQRLGAQPAFGQNAPKVLRYSVHKLLQRKKYPDALSCGADAGAACTSVCGRIHMLGQAYLANGKRSEAVRSFENAVKLDAFETGTIEWLRTLNVS